jgi:hypothetical protein
MSPGEFASPSWLILAVLAWFIEPWLVLPAIVVAEIGWIVALQCHGAVINGERDREWALEDATAKRRLGSTQVRDPLHHLAKHVRGSLLACDHDDRLRSITLVSPKSVKRTATGQDVSTGWDSDGIASVRTD